MEYLVFLTNMNLAARYFLNSWYYGPVNTSLGKLFMVLAFCACFFQMSTTCYAQENEQLLKTADAYYDKEQFHSAAQYYQVAVGIEGNDPETAYRLAQSYRAIFKYSLAANYYQRVLELDQVSYPLARFYLAQMQKSIGNFKQARDGFESFIENNQKPSSLTKKDHEDFIKQAELEIEGCSWAIEQLGKSWTEMGFTPMPEPVNSVSNDYAATMVGDEPLITITSGKKGAKGGLLDNRFGEYFTDNFRYRLEEDGWVLEHVSDHFDRTNTKFSDGVGTYNKAGEKYYFTSCYEGNAYCKLYVTYKENGTWKNPELLNENVNAPGFDNKHPTLNSRGDTLIFVSNRSGGNGGYDLWYCVSSGEEEWGKAKPLPEGINTPFNEASPFYYQDNLLFFSSDGHSGMGGMDIFMATGYQSAESSLQNLGTPFNSGYDDSFFSLGGGKGYLSSNRPNGKGKFDIYSFTIPQENSNLSEYLEESAEGTHLRSRVRGNDGSNLYAARDEDQFYYDNLSPEDRARLDRIIGKKQENTGDFDPSELSKDDYKYYRKLDIATKAAIERLAQKRITQWYGASSPMTIQEKLDWEFYQNMSKEERLIVDRIIDVQVEARRRAIREFNQQEKIYASNSTNRERIESKLQLRSLDLLENKLANQQQQGTAKFGQNQSELEAIAATQAHLEYTNDRIGEYEQVINGLSQSHLVNYRHLDPKDRNDLHRSALHEFVLTSSLKPEHRETLISQLGLNSRPFDQDSQREEPEITKEIRAALVDNLKSISADTTLTVQQLAALELYSQQKMLLQHLDQIDKMQTDTRDLQGQIKQYLSEREQAPDPGMEDEIVEGYFTQVQQLLPALSAKESHYFEALNPSHQLRIERLAGLVHEQTEELLVQEDESKQFLPGQYASDLWYYRDLSPQEQNMVDALVQRGWNPEQPYTSNQKKFIDNLSADERTRIDRMMGNQGSINFEIPQDRRLAITGPPVTEMDPEDAAPEISNAGPEERQEKSKEANVQSGTGREKNDKAPFTVNNPPESPYPDTQSVYSGAQIYFDFDQYTLRSEAKNALIEMVHFLENQEKPVRVVIEGHADDIGNSAHNDRLSEQRSLSAAEVFQPASGHIEVTTVGFGERRPLSNNRTARGRQLNRRVELKIQGIPFQSTLQILLVRPNVTLQMIVEATGLLESDIMIWNGLKDKKLRAYQPIRLPMDLDYNSLRHLLYNPSRKEPVVGDNANVYKVQAGENLFRLALRYNTTVKALEHMNNITASDLRAGQPIKVR